MFFAIFSALNLSQFQFSTWIVSNSNKKLNDKKPSKCRYSSPHSIMLVFFTQIAFRLLNFVHFAGNGLLHFFTYWVLDVLYFHEISPPKHTHRYYLHFLQQTRVFDCSFQISSKCNACSCNNFHKQNDLTGVCLLSVVCISKLQIVCVVACVCPFQNHDVFFYYQSIFPFLQKLSYLVAAWKNTVSLQFFL